MKSETSDPLVAINTSVTSQHQLDRARTSSPLSGLTKSQNSATASNRFQHFQLLAPTRCPHSHGSGSTGLPSLRVVPLLERRWSSMSRSQSSGVDEAAFVDSCRRRCCPNPLGIVIAMGSAMPRRSVFDSLKSQSPDMEGDDLSRHHTHQQHSASHCYQIIRSAPPSFPL